MRAKIYILTLVCMLGFFLIPGLSYACKAHTKVKIEKSCCKASPDRHHSTRTCQEDCCKDKRDDSEDCSGKCGNKSCQTPSQSFSEIPTLFTVLQDLFDVEGKKLYALYKQPHYSSGYLSIWLPPKIG